MDNELKPELERLQQSLCSKNSTLVLSTLDELDATLPSRAEAEIIQKAYKSETDPILSFQIKKSLRLAAFKLKGKSFKVSLESFETLLSDPNRLEDLALAIATVEAAEAFLLVDAVRNANWQSFAAKILPSFCKFIKEHGNIQDTDSLQELTRHSDPSVLTSALSALEHIDPTNLQSIITPLVNSPKSVIKGQAIQALYKWDKAKATQHLISMLFSAHETDVALALHHATFFPYKELEPHLLRLTGDTKAPSLLMRISKLFKLNAYLDLPFKLFWVARSLQGSHQRLVKGMLMGVVRELVSKKLIKCSAEEFSNQLNNRVRKEELELLKKTCNVREISHDDGGLPDLDFFAEPENLPLPASITNTYADAETDVINNIDNLSQKAKSKKFSDELIGKAKETKKPIPKSKTTISNVDFTKYDQLPLKERTKFLRNLSEEQYLQHKSLVTAKLTSSESKEVVAVINIIGILGNADDSRILQKLLKSKDPAVVSATIRALAKIDQEHLCIYLPQLMQDKNGKVRMTATRAFLGIDRESIKSLLTSMLFSSNVQLRTLAISSAMLVDFNLIRNEIVEALQKEKSEILVEKIGVVLAANPDRELLNAVYFAIDRSRCSLKSMKGTIIIALAETLSLALGNIASPEELLEDAAKAADEHVKTIEKEQTEVEEREKKKVYAEKKVTVTEILTDNSSAKTKSKRAKITFFVLIFAAILWGAVVIFIILKYLL